MNTRVALATNALGTNTFRYVLVPAKGALSEGLTEAALKAGSGSANSRSLTEQFMLEPTSPKNFVVTGANNTIAALTLADALSRLKGQKLAHRRVAFVGASGFEEVIKKAADEAGIEVKYVVYP